MINPHESPYAQYVMFKCKFKINLLIRTTQSLERTIRRQRYASVWWFIIYFFRIRIWWPHSLVRLSQVEHRKFKLVLTSESHADRVVCHTHKLLDVLADWIICNLFTEFILPRVNKHNIILDQYFLYSFWNTYFFFSHIDNIAPTR